MNKSLKNGALILCAFLVLFMTFSISYRYFPGRVKYNIVISCFNHGIYPNGAINSLVESGQLTTLDPNEAGAYITYQLGAKEADTPKEHYRVDALYILAIYMMNHTAEHSIILSAVQFENVYNQMLALDKTLFYFRGPFYFATHRKGLSVDSIKAKTLADYFEQYRAVYPESDADDASAVLNDYDLFLQVSMNLLTQADLYDLAGDAAMSEQLKQTQEYILQQYALNEKE